MRNNQPKDLRRIKPIAAIGEASEDMGEPQTKLAKVEEVEAMEPESWGELLGLEGVRSENSEIPWDEKTCEKEEAAFLKALQKLSGDRPLALSAPSQGVETSPAVHSHSHKGDWPASPSKWELSHLPAFEDSLDSGFSAQSECSGSDDEVPRDIPFLPA